MNENIKKLRQEIAKLEKEQRNAKEQRRTVRFNGERTMTPLEAYYKVLSNKETLRVMYAAYGLMRGRKFREIENHWNGETHPLFDYANSINDVLNEYGCTMEYEEEENKYWHKTYKVFKENCDEKIIYLGQPEA